MFTYKELIKTINNGHVTLRIFAEQSTNIKWIRESVGFKSSKNRMIKLHFQLYLKYGETFKETKANSNTSNVKRISKK